MNSWVNNMHYIIIAWVYLSNRGYLGKFPLAGCVFYGKIIIIIIIHFKNIIYIVL